MAVTKRKPRTPHPGITLVRPSGDRAAWALRFVNPDTGRWTKERLDPERYPNAKARLEAAKEKSRQLAERRAELERGAVRMTGSTIAAEVERYFENHPELRPKTRRAYQDASAKLVTWCAAKGIDSVDTLDQAALKSFRASLIAAPKHGQRQGLPRGKAAPTAERRSVHTVNRELRAIKSILGDLRESKRLPRLDQQAIFDGLKHVRAPKSVIEFLRSPEIERLLDAALRHDAERFAETRDEHRGLLPRGSTARYAPIAPAVFGALVTGMRLGELVTVTWRTVDLDAKGSDGAPVGEILIPPEITKTHRGRVVDLAVSPALRRLLEAMRPEAREALDGPVFGVSYDEATAAGKRLVRAYEAPETFSWQACRRTCGTFLTNAPGIFGAASAYRSAQQLGHSVTVAERHYLGVVRGISPDAKTVEAAMEIEAMAERVIAAAMARSGRTNNAKVIDLRTRRGRA